MYDNFLRLTGMDSCTKTPGYTAFTCPLFLNMQNVCTLRLDPTYFFSTVAPSLRLPHFLSITLTNVSDRFYNMKKCWIYILTLIIKTNCLLVGCFSYYLIKCLRSQYLKKRTEKKHIGHFFGFEIKMKL